jgi:hypothetical protein
MQTEPQIDLNRYKEYDNMDIRHLFKLTKFKEDPTYKKALYDRGLRIARRTIISVILAIAADIGIGYLTYTKLMKKSKSKLLKVLTTLLAVFLTGNIVYPTSFYAQGALSFGRRRRSRRRRSRSRSKRRRSRSRRRRSRRRSRRV